MSTLIYRIEQELRKRFIDAKFHDITIHMKNSGHDLTITPISVRTGNIQNIKDIDFFSVDSPALPWLGGDTLTEIAEGIANYDEKLEYLKSNRERCTEYYLKHLKGKPFSTNKDGCEYLSLAFDKFNEFRENPKTSHKYLTLQDFLNHYNLQLFAPDKDYEYVKEAINVARALETYSDWHKDLYGFRPKNWSSDTHF